MVYKFKEYLLEELDINFEKTNYTKHIVDDDNITYEFKMFNYTFNINLHRNIIYEGNEKYIDDYGCNGYIINPYDTESVNYEEYGEYVGDFITYYYEINFNTNEKKFDTLNISNIAPLKIYSMVISILFDFTKENKCNLFVFNHKSLSRCRVFNHVFKKINNSDYKITEPEEIRGLFDISYRQLIYNKNKFNKSFISEINSYI